MLAVAWTTTDASDYTAIAVIGVDHLWNIFVLDLARFKTDDFSVYYDAVAGLHNEWGFKKLHIESNAGGQIVSNEVKRLARENGSVLIVKGEAAQRNPGKKAERHAAVLLPRVKNGNVWFAKGGLTSVAIEEIVLERPPHDDLKDALTEAIRAATPPTQRNQTSNNVVKMKFNKRFGGRAR